MRVTVAVLASLGFAGSMSGQTSFPMITHCTPVAIERGKATEVLVEGQMNFHGSRQVLVAGQGIKATVILVPVGKNDPKQRPVTRSVKLRFEVDPDAALGVREFRIASTLGLSSLGQILVVDEPVILEQGVNNTLAQAAPISIPAVVCGRIEAAEDVDYFRFSAKAGQHLTFEVFGARLEDKIHDLQKHLDPLVALFDPEGREVAASDDSYFADPLLTYKIPKDGYYTIQIRDAKYDGDARWVYALRATDRPYVSHVFPMAANPRSTVNVTPVGSAKESLPRLTMTAPSLAGTHALQADVAGRTTNPFAFHVTSLPIVSEQEPNDTIDQATRISVPCVVNGRIGARRDLDHFVFPGRKAQPLRLEVRSRRFGTLLQSGLDSFVEILSMKGQVVASNDDDIGKDSGLVFNPPADGDYVVRVRDLNSKGGDTFVYCLEIAPAQQSFAIRVDPGKAMIGPGSSTPWYVTVTRANGFSGPVDVAVEGLPDAVSVNRLTIPSTMTQGLLVLNAGTDAKLGAAPVRVIGRAVVGDKPVERIATVSEEIYLPGGGRGRFEAEMPAVAVTEPSDILAVSVSPARISLRPGQEVRLDVTIKRRADYDKSVTLDVLLRHLGTVFGNPLPPGVTVVEGKSKTLIGTGNTGHIVLKAAPDAAPIEGVPVSVLAHVSINFVVKISYSSPVIPLSIGK
jgi:hypothetical protein